jgi:hypothetical protein
MALRDLVDHVLGRSSYVPAEMRDHWGETGYAPLPLATHDVDRKNYAPPARLAQAYAGAQLNCYVPFAGYLLGRPGSVPVSDTSREWYQQTPMTNLPGFSRQLVGLAPQPAPGPLTLQAWMSRGLGDLRTGSGAVPAVFPFIPY